MGVSHSWGELAGKVNRLANDYGDIPAIVVPDAALIVKEAVTAIAPSSLRGVGKKGAKLTVRYNVSKAPQNAKALVFARGPWQLIEADTRAHRIPKERTRGRKRVVVIPGVGVRAYANHPGTKGKHPWEKGTTAARPVIDRLFATAGSLPLRRIF